MKTDKDPIEKAMADLDVLIKAVDTQVFPGMRKEDITNIKKWLVGVRSNLIDARGNLLSSVPQVEKERILAEQKEVLDRQHRENVERQLADQEKELDENYRLKILDSHLGDG